VNQYQQQCEKLRIAKDRSSISILEGSILTLLGFGVWLYAESAVLGLALLVNASATQEESARYYGALQWWRLQQISLFNPLAAMLIAAGLVLIGNSIYWVVRRRTQAG